MDFNLSPRAFLGQFTAKDMTAKEKFLAVSASISDGQTLTELSLVKVRKAWLKKILSIMYDNSYYHQAQVEGWVKPHGRGKFSITDKGYSHLDDIAITNTLSNNSKGSTKLYVFELGKTHTFDKFLRSVFAGTNKEIRIADSYVDETIFDNLLDQIPDSAEIYLIYRKKQGSFDARIKRFSTQYSKFMVKNYSQLHDRFLIVDDTGYIIGPSLKDAARKSPALVVELNQKDTKSLRSFFDQIWAASH